MATELKPCPFCGGEAKYFNGIATEWKPLKAYCFVYCSECKTKTQEFDDKAGDFEYKRKATEAWNRRAENGS